MARIADILRLGRVQTAGVTALTGTIGVLLAGGLSTVPHGTLAYLIFPGAMVPMAHVILVSILGLDIHIFGFTLNEYMDHDIDMKADHLANKPLVNGSVSMKEARIILALTGALMLILGLSIVPFDIPVALVFLASVTLGIIYNTGGKHFPGSDLFLAGWAGLFCLWGGMSMFSTGPAGIELSRFTGQLPWQVYVAAALVFAQVAFNNSVEGGMKDAATDRRAGARTLAVLMGVKWTGASRLLLPPGFRAYALALKGPVILMGILVLLYHWPGYIAGSISVLLLTGMSASFVAFMFRQPSGGRKQLLKIFSIHEIFTFWLAVVLFAPVLGLPTVLVLVLLPVVWYVLINRLLHGSTLAPGV